MSTLHAPVPPKPKVSDSGGEEAGSDGQAFGAPESWTFRDMVRIATAVLTRNPRLVAGLAGIAAAGAGLDYALGRPRIIEGLLGFPVGVLAMGATYMTVVEDREELRIEEVSSRYLSRVPAALLTPLYLGLMIGLGILGCVLVGGFFHLVDLPMVGTLVGVVLGLGVAFYGAVYGQLLGQEVVLGGTSGREAMGRSFAMTKDQLGAVFLPGIGFQMVGNAILLLGLVAAIIPGLMTGLVAPASTHGAIFLAAGTCGALFGGTLGVWIVAGLSLVYLRAKARAA